MTSQVKSAIVFIIIAIAVVLFIVSASGSKNTTPAVPVTTPPVATTTDTGTVTTTTTPGVTTYTLADVAKHSVKTDCWTAINGNVYNLTPFIPNHPGGDAILIICGKDGSAAFADQHGDQRRPNNELAALKIGVLVQ